LMGFQQDFGDRLSDDETQTMVKLEENYRSTANILEAANALIEHNTERIDKILKATRGEGDTIFCFRADDEQHEAEFVVDQIRSIERDNPEVNFGEFAILYRTNAQSRPFEDSLVRWGIPYTVVGGLKFYDRKEIKDVLSYLRLIANPADTVSLQRVINTPRRGVGKTTLDRLGQAAQELGVPLWEILSDESAVKTLAARSAKPILQFVAMIQQWQTEVDTKPAADIIQEVLDKSGYVRDLQDQGTDEAEERLGNVKELYNAALQYAEENDDQALNTFLASAALASDADSKETTDKVTLMTLHSAKGLEFPIVFLVGLEQGLFPNFRSLDDPAAIEEERRLCYVGITRAQERLFISHARERRLFGSREPAVASLFLSEIPRELMQLNSPLAIPKHKPEMVTLTKAKPSALPNTHAQDWSVGDRLLHKGFGIGVVTHIFGAGASICLAVKFPGMGQKILDPKITALERVS
jgi:DNA helicase II / ATP-dependent DNA helicase PcrA